MSGGNMERILRLMADKGASDCYLSANMPVLIVAIGMTLIILSGQIDISVGSQFAICSMAAGVLAIETTRDQDQYALTTPRGDPEVHLSSLVHAQSLLL